VHCLQFTSFYLNSILHYQEKERKRPLETTNTTNTTNTTSTSRTERISIGIETRTTKTEETEKGEIIEEGASASETIGSIKTSSEAGPIKTTPLQFHEVTPDSGDGCVGSECVGGRVGVKGGVVLSVDVLADAVVVRESEIVRGSRVEEVVVGEELGREPCSKASKVISSETKAIYISTIRKANTTFLEIDGGGFLSGRDGVGESESR